MVAGTDTATDHRLLWRLESHALQIQPVALERETPPRRPHLWQVNVWQAPSGVSCNGLVLIAS